MIIGRSMILASQEPLTAGTFTYPAHRLHLGDWANEVTYIVNVQGTVGAPLGGTLNMSTVFAVMPHTTGNQYLNEQLFGFDAVQRVNLTAEAEDWPNPICLTTATFPVTFQRTYIGFGKDIRLSLGAAFTGGTTPAFTVSVVAHAKG